jgi:UPF0271 protein
VSTIDLNADVAEGFPYDPEILSLVTSANVCCGEHAGSWDQTLATFELCRERGVRIGLHPGYPDRENMGRASLDRIGLSVAAAMDSLRGQIERALAKCQPAYLKPHGALYHETMGVSGVSDAFPGLLREFRLPLMGLAGTHHERMAEAAGVAFLSEGFADRGYTADGKLIPRGVAGALVTESRAAAAQAVRLAPKVDSLCVHGDTPNCLEILSAVRAELLASGYEVVA